MTSQTGLDMFYAFYWVIPRSLNFIYGRFGTLCLFLLHRRVGMDWQECSETSAYKIQMPGNYPEENIQRSKHGESLKPKMCCYLVCDRCVCNTAVTKRSHQTCCWLPPLPSAPYFVTHFQKKTHRVSRPLLRFMFSLPYILIKKPKWCTDFSNLFLE